MLKQRLTIHNNSISKIIQEFLDKNKEKFSNHYWTEDIMDRLSLFNTGGKMVRGGLVIESYLEFSKSDSVPPYVFKIAAAIELFSSGLLIHDDILDKDEVRRGKPSMHTQYRDLAQKNNYQDSHHFGTSMGVFIGNIEYFLSFFLISELNIDPITKNKLLSLFSKELIGVSLAELHDVKLSNDVKVTEKEILDMYRLKTARYSFLLPLVTGAILAQQSQNTLDLLENFAENIGIIFQIKDDEMGIFGDSEKIGKPVGNDIREGKKTLFWLYALKMADEDTRKKLLSIFGNNRITQQNIVFIQNHLNDSGAIQSIDALVSSLAEEAREKSRDLQKNLEQNSALPSSLFNQLIDYNLERKK